MHFSQTQAQKSAIVTIGKAYSQGEVRAVSADLTSTAPSFTSAGISSLAYTVTSFEALSDVRVRVSPLTTAVYPLPHADPSLHR